MLLKRPEKTWLIEDYADDQTTTTLMMMSVLEMMVLVVIKIMDGNWMMKLLFKTMMLKAPVAV